MLLFSWYLAIFLIFIQFIGTEDFVNEYMSSLAGRGAPFGIGRHWQGVGQVCGGFVFGLFRPLTRRSRL